MVFLLNLVKGSCGGRTSSSHFSFFHQFSYCPKPCLSQGILLLDYQDGQNSIWGTGLMYVLQSQNLPSLCMPQPLSVSLILQFTGHAWP